MCNSHLLITGYHTLQLIIKLFFFSLPIFWHLVLGIWLVCITASQYFVFWSRSRFNSKISVVIVQSDLFILLFFQLPCVTLTKHLFSLASCPCSHPVLSWGTEEGWGLLGINLHYCNQELDGGIKPLVF